MAIALACGDDDAAKEPPAPPPPTQVVDARAEAAPLTPQPVDCVAGASACTIVDCSGGSDPCLCPAGSDCAFNCSTAGREIRGSGCATHEMLCSQASCNVICTGEGCGGTTVTCGGGPCNVRCSGPNACTSVIVSCGDSPCEVVCDDAESCKSVVVECGTAPCKASCPNGGQVEVVCRGPSCVNECQ